MTYISINTQPAFASIKYFCLSDRIYFRQTNKGVDDIEIAWLNNSYDVTFYDVIAQ